MISPDFLHFGLYGYGLGKLIFYVVFELHTLNGECMSKSLPLSMGAVQVFTLTAKRRKTVAAQNLY